ncbi:MAG: chromosome segregation protein SMC [Anaerolineales bacterium]|jgi:chromosome segregation protein|nr:chromosome segregation protein SMC [Anaerolineales bacterium]
MPANLKSLELHGYKTFANRTNFSFAETVTAIVGPNGSGKSNIADSLRWVLGEQSYSLLRGRKTEDMIFSGSEARSRAGMASATITLDNSSGWLPIDFSEVAITRRAHRDGLNEYLINGQRVRLRDVSELLAASGLAERTYTVIGQGLVDAALSLKADERRRLFEEAAGIGLHRSRREETLRRLETTKRNLERVEDILAELKPRLHSLERQARRAQEYEQVRQDLHAQLREWYGFHWVEAQRSQAEALQADRQQEIRLERARQEQEKVEAKTNALQSAIQGLRDELNGWHRQLAELHRQREAALRQLAVVEERQRALNVQQENDQRDQAELLEVVKFQEQQVAAAVQERGELAAEVEEARRLAEEARQALEGRQAERVEAESRIQRARQNLSALNAAQGRLQAQQTEGAAQEKRLAEALQARQAALAAAEQELAAAQEAQRTAQRGSETSEAALQQAEQELAAHKEKLLQAEAGLASARERQAELQAEAMRFKAGLEVIEQAEAALEGYTSGTKVLLEAQRQQRLHGAHGALSAFLETPAEYEPAIAAALGDFLDAVLLEADPEAALDLLETEAGRGALLPVHALKPAPLKLHSLKGVPGVIGEAAGLVQAAPEAQRAVELLLSGVIVVQDRRAAQRALAGQPAGARAVTLKGEVFYLSGPIISGRAKTGGAQTLLSRRRQRGEAAAALQKNQAELRMADRRLEQVTAELERLRAEAQRLEAQGERQRQAVLEAARRLEGARAGLGEAERRLAWNKEQISEIEAQQRSRGEAARRAADELAQLGGQIDAARAELRAGSAALEGLALDDLQTQQAHWATRLAVAERALQDAGAREAERSLSHERTRASLAGLEQRLTGLAQALQDAAQECGQARAEETRQAGLIQSLNERIQPAEAKLHEQENKLAADQKEAGAARQQLSIAERLYAQTRINLARQQEALQSLQRRIEEDFGLVAFEYTAQVSGQTPLPLMGMVEQLPPVQKLSPEIEENIKRLRAQLRRMGPINPEAQTEFHEVKERHAFLIAQTADLKAAEADIRLAIAELDDLMQREFKKTYESVAAEFHQIFARLFGGGSARLLLTDADDLTNTGIEIEARLPGRRAQGLALLSGGERSLTATALVFALLKVSPTPFCVLDEVDAMLDEANVGRFRELLRELSQQTQFVIVTHNRNTVQVADVIYGVTMGKDSTSQVLSLKLDEISQVIE